MQQHTLIAKKVSEKILNDPTKSTIHILTILRSSQFEVMAMHIRYL